MKELHRYRLFESARADAKGAKLYWFLYTDGEGMPKTYLGHTAKLFFTRYKEHQDPQISDKGNLSEGGFCLVTSPKLSSALEKIIAKKLEMTFIKGNPGGRAEGDRIGEIIAGIHTAMQALRDYRYDIITITPDEKIIVNNELWFFYAFDSETALF